jgi:hypothetical protein
MQANSRKIAAVDAIGRMDVDIVRANGLLCSEAARMHVCTCYTTVAKQPESRRND